MKMSLGILLESSSLDMVISAIDVRLSSAPGKAVWMSLGVSNSLNKTEVFI